MLKLIKYHPQYAYSVGDVFEVNKKDTEYLLKEKYATEATADEVAEYEAKILGTDDTTEKKSGKKGGK